MTLTRVALVTGGAKRVGRGVVERLVAGGFDVAFTYLASETEAESLAGEIRAAGRKALAIRVDLTQPVIAVETIRREFSQAFHRLDVLVNSASIYAAADLSRSTVELSRRLMAIHVESPLLLCQAFAEPLRSARGHVINMVDLLAERPWPQYLTYCASKAALASLTLGLARELAPEVTVNGIAPGVVEWPANYPEADKQQYLKRVPLARAGTPNDVGELVHFLATGGSYISGQIIRLDGGRSIM